MVESGSSLVMETEPVFASLANILKVFNNIDTIPEELQKYELEELEVQHINFYSTVWKILTEEKYLD